MDSIISTAVAELGQKEISGPDAHNQTIVNYAHESGFNWVNDDETPWCSIFVNWVAKKSNLKGTNKANARSWLLIGQNTDTNPEPGDVVIFWRESIHSWKGHVGFFFGYSKSGDRVYCLGGNQGNQVSISAYPTDTVLGFRRLQPSTIVSLPEPDLQKGDTGDQVKALQDALKMAGFNCGTSDGDFGNKTFSALKELQSASGFLKIDGVYGAKTKDYLFNILNE
ncbi:TIGR02594 family protein [Fulvivirga sp. RKSG066]|uniref:C40 family peptidase n=1 Tax=Fulvivirga aurantia TaxID=2529383 RepID=UPI0012BC5F4A|nr:TIGR02594 family protein [Fulvivirga aurantia]MTI22657.1 TIGR02594 family protein [Fulvivirga aurantia]